MATYVLISLGAALLAVVTAMAWTAYAAQRTNTAAVVDVTWGLGFALIAVVTGIVGTAVASGDDLRRWIVVALVVPWALRLAWHIRGRAIGEHAGKEDPRYEKLLGGTLDRVGLGVFVRKVLLVQGAAMVVIASPVAVGAVADVDWWWAVWLGVVVWLVGLVFESVGDAQLSAYKAIPKAERPQVLETGLWRYTRHPNYFGDSCVWWGIWLAGGLASGWVVALATVIAPIAMTYFIVFATGAKLLERTMMQRPGYPAYAARTSMFFPLPPRKA